MGTPIYYSKHLAAANDAIIAANQTLVGASNLALVGGGTVVLDTSRQVVLTFAADETGHNFTIYGSASINAGTGAPISEVIAGTTAGTVVSTLMYGTITRIAVSAATTGNVKAGTNGVGATFWKSMNYQVSPFSLAIACVVTGTINYSIQYTYDDFWTVTPNTGQGVNPTAFTDPILSAVTASGETTINNPVTGVRLLINSGTGTVAVKMIQADISGA